MHTLEWQEAEEWNIDYKIVWGQILKALNAKPGSLPLVLRTTASEHFKISNEAGILEKVIDINEKIGLQGKGTSGRMFSSDIITWYEVMEGSGTEKGKKQET